MENLAGKAWLGGRRLPRPPLGAGTARLPEVLVHLAYHDRALTHGRRDALDGSGAHVADGEHAGHARLERQRRPLERPALRRSGGDGHSGSRYDVAPCVPLDGLREPLRPWPRTDQEEEPRRVNLALLAGLAITQGQPLEVPLPASVHDLRAVADLDVARRLDLVEQVARHAGVQRPRPYDECDPSRVAG